MVSHYLVHDASLESPKLLPDRHILQAFSHTSKPASIKWFIQASPVCPIIHCKQTFTNAFSLHQALFVNSSSVAIGIWSIKLYISVSRLSAPQGKGFFDAKWLWSTRNPSSHSQQGRQRHDFVTPGPHGAGWRPCSPPPSPPAENSCKSHGPGWMEPFGEAPGNILQLRNYQCKRSSRSQRTLEKGAESCHPCAEAAKHDQLWAEKEESLQVTQPRTSQRWRATDIDRTMLTIKWETIGK